MGAWTRRAAAGLAGIVAAALLLQGLALLLVHGGSSDTTREANAKRQAHLGVKARLADRRTERTGKQASAQPRLDAAAARPDRRVALAPRPEPPPPIKKPPETEPKGQIVETARPEHEQQPQDARYLGRYDMQVEREQKSRGHQRKGRDLGRVHIDNPSELQSPNSKSRDPTKVAGASGPPAQRPGERAGQAAASPPKRIATAERVRSARRAPAAVAAAPAPTQVASAQPPVQPTHGPQPGVAPTAPEAPGSAPELAPDGAPRSDMIRPSVTRGGGAGLLLPSTSSANVLHNMQALSGEPGSNDYLPDVEDEGDTNLLNTRKFRYWDFYQRVRERVGGEWNPVSVWQSRDPNGRRYGVRDRLTIVRVRLDPTGQVKDLQVRKPSGLSFLDDEAMRAFSAAGPYPNPPAGLVNERGEVEFQFGFMFEISASRFRFFRAE